MSLHVPTAALERLAVKYEAMARLRRHHARGMPPAPRPELRALARDFPGSLAELDTIETAEIESRIRDLRAALAGGPRPSWIAHMHAYHAALSEAIGHRGSSDPIEARRSRTGLPIDAAFLEGIRARPNGRVIPVVLAAIARWSGADPDLVARSILPRRRRT